MCYSGFGYINKHLCSVASLFGLLDCHYMLSMESYKEPCNRTCTTRTAFDYMVGLAVIALSSRASGDIEWSMFTFSTFKFEGGALNGRHGFVATDLTKTTTRNHWETQSHNAPFTSTNSPWRCQSQGQTTNQRRSDGARASRHTDLVKTLTDAPCDHIPSVPAVVCLEQSMTAAAMVTTGVLLGSTPDVGVDFPGPVLMT
ncbi:hypothetical protein LXA43DRAFT_641916 [Ganoderma leucocontextum]|nr:hypothetical protein LXA43DRAFT_641916 [Ganoderma leucocontextum]